MIALQLGSHEHAHSEPPCHETGKGVAAEADAQRAALDARKRVAGCTMQPAKIRYGEEDQPEASGKQPEQDETNERGGAGPYGYREEEVFNGPSDEEEVEGRDKRADNEPYTAFG